jgi:hypothetical protein
VMILRGDDVQNAPEAADTPPDGPARLPFSPVPEIGRTPAERRRIRRLASKGML